MKILLYGLNFAPEPTGIGKYNGEMAAWLSEAGHEVRVIAAQPYYPAWTVAPEHRGWRNVVERIAGVQVTRTPLWVPANPSGLKRVLHLASFAVLSFPALMQHMFWKPHVVLTVAPAFACAPGGWLAARLCGAKAWLHIQDFEIDAAFKMGLLRGRFASIAFGLLERSILRRFDRVSTISGRMLSLLRSKGVSESRAVLFPNWVDINAISPARTEGSYRAELKIPAGAVVALYSGSMAGKQGLELLPIVARAVAKSMPQLVFVLCGDGVCKAGLERDCAGLSNVRMLPLQPTHRLGELLSMADIHLLPQSSAAADLVMPSKLTGMLASGRPVLATAMPGTELADVVSQVGRVVPPGDVRAFIQALSALLDSAALRAELGAAARLYAEQYLAREGVMSDFDQALRRCVGTMPRPKIDAVGGSLPPPSKSPARPYERSRPSTVVAAAEPMKMRYIDHASGGALQQAFPRLPAPETAASYLDAGASAQADAKIPWGIYWKSIKKRRWSILALAAVLTALAFLYAQSIQPVFRSTVTLLIESGKAKFLNIEEVYNGVSQDREYYQTQVEILRSRDIALRTVVATKLWDEPEYDPRRSVRSWQGRLKDFFSPPPPQPTWTQERLADAALGKFLGAIMIEPVRLSQLVKISIEAEDPKLAAKLANAMANSFIVADRETRLNLNVSVTGQLQDRLTALRTKLLQSEQELQKYREQGGLVAMSGSQGIAGQQLSEISQRLVAARVRRTELESAYQQVARLGDGDKSLPSLVNSPGLVEAQFRVSSATLALEDVTRNLGDQHSRVIEARNALAAAQQQLQLQTRAVVAGLRRDAQAARETERSLDSALSAARTSVQGVNRQEFQLGVLEREVQTNKQLYELFLSRTKETSVSTDLQQAVARIVDAANAATAPLRPNKTQIVLAVLLLALSSGSIAAVLFDRMKNTLIGSEDAERRLNLPVLASLPAVRPSETYGLPWAFLDHPKWPHSNAIRSAHTSILLTKYDRSHKLILVTSAVSGEGKTTFCTNLAFAQAQTRRTILIDCDMRNPQIAAQLGLPKDAKGISNLVLGTADVNECVHGVTGSSLLVMPAGDLPATPEEMLLSPQFRSALKSLASRVDIVIIDSAPVLACSDALIIGQQVNDIIYVVKARETPHVMAQRGLQRLMRAGANVLGMVLTGVEAATPNSKLRRKIPDYGDSQQFDENSVFG